MNKSDAQEWADGVNAYWKERGREAKARIIFIRPGFYVVRSEVKGWWQG